MSFNLCGSCIKIEAEGCTCCKSLGTIRDWNGNKRRVLAVDGAESIVVFDGRHHTQDPMGADREATDIYVFDRNRTYLSCHGPNVNKFGIDPAAQVGTCPLNNERIPRPIRTFMGDMMDAALSGKSLAAYTFWLNRVYLNLVSPIMDDRIVVGGTLLICPCEGAMQMKGREIIRVEVVEKE